MTARGLKHAGTKRLMAALQADTPASEKVRHRCERLTAVTAVAAHGEDEIAKGEIAVYGFQGLFHGLDFLVGFVEMRLRNPSADDAAIIGKANATAFEQVSDSHRHFRDVATGTAHREDEVAESEAAFGCFEILVHWSVFGWLIVCSM